jgi:hypothetical protein
MDKTSTILTALFIIALCMIGGGLLGNAWDKLSVEYEESKARTAALPPQPMPADPLVISDETWTVIAWLIGNVVGIIIINAIIKSEHALPIFITLFGLILVIIVMGIFTYGDKTGDGTPDSIIIGVVQPSGNPVTDEQYAEINNTNADANITNAGAGAIYASLIWVTVIVCGGFIVILSFAKK